MSSRRRTTHLALTSRNCCPISTFLNTSDYISFDLYSLLHFLKFLKWYRFSSKNPCGAREMSDRLNTHKQKYFFSLYLGLIWFQSYFGLILISISLHFHIVFISFSFQIRVVFMTFLFHFDFILIPISSFSSPHSCTIWKQWFFGLGLNVAQRNSNLPKIGLTLHTWRKGDIQEECNHLSQVLKFNSQYFPRFVFENRPFSE